MNTESTSVTVDLKLYSRDAIRKTAYKFTGEWYVELSPTTGDHVTILLSPKRVGGGKLGVRAEFLNELLDQTLREQIAAETLAVRNLIMAHALGRLELLQPTDDTNSSGA